jgi:hypothetical protein
MSILDYARGTKVHFDINNAEHLRAYKVFCDTHKWDTDLRFMLDPKYLSIPHMVDHMLAMKYLSDHVSKI